MLTLYDCATAPSPRRARIFLAEKGIAHDTVQVDLRSGEQLGEAFRRINPQCTVPALRTEGGLVLADNAGIAAYLEARFPEPPLRQHARGKGRHRQLELARRVRRPDGHRRGAAQQRAGHGRAGAAGQPQLRSRSRSWPSAAWRAWGTFSTC